MMNFENLLKAEEEISHNDFILYTRENVNEVNKAFDLIFFPATNESDELGPEIKERLLKNLRFLLKPDGILISSFIMILKKNAIWLDGLFSYFMTNGNVPDITKISDISKDPDLFVIPESIYESKWRPFTEKAPDEYGKIFCYNIFFEGREKVGTENFDKFTVSWGDTKFFDYNSYSQDFDGNNNINETIRYRTLLAYSYIISNFQKTSRILVISDDRELNTHQLKKKLSDRHCIRQLSHVDFLSYGNREGDGNSNEKYDAIIFVDGNSNIVLEKINTEQIIKRSGDLLTDFGSLLLIIHDYRSPFYKKILALQHPGLVMLNDHRKLNGLLNTNDKKHILKDYNVLYKKTKYLPGITRTRPDHLRKKYPVYFFHHIMKSGGTSVFNILDSWFKTIDDNIFNEDINVYLQKKYNTDLLHNDICLRAHFQREGIYLHQRYPEVWDNDEFRIFTFLREPFSLRVSHYFYLENQGVFKNFTLRQYLETDDNFISGLFPLNESNYREILDKYFFIGITERMQESFDKLAVLAGKRKMKVPFLNVSKKNSQIDQLDADVKKKFKERNKVDYMIYEYCLNKFEQYK